MSHDAQRRRLIAQMSATGLAALALPTGAIGQALDRPLTPSCDGHAAVTRRQTEGPFFTRGSPARRDLRGDGGGELLVLSGFVLTRQCRPVAGAVLDLWHADDAGDYDNAGFRFRGHQVSDDQGRYQFITRRPGLYPGRTRHLHIKVQAGRGPVLTTQLYFPGEAGNARDGLFDRALLMQLGPGGGGSQGRFDFVIAT